MAFTQAQLDAIDTAITSGALSVRFQDREITYRSLKDLLAARTIIATALGQPAIRQVRMETKTGL